MYLGHSLLVVGHRKASLSDMEHASRGALVVLGVVEHALHTPCKPTYVHAHAHGVRKDAVRIRLTQCACNASRTPCE